MKKILALALACLFTLPVFGFINARYGWGQVALSVSAYQVIQFAPAVHEVSMINNGTGVVYFAYNMDTNNSAWTTNQWIMVPNTNAWTNAFAAGTTMVIPAGQSFTLSRGNEQDYIRTLFIASATNVTNSVTINAY